MMNHNLTIYSKRIFFIGAHPDDIELGCGALISNIGSQSEIFCITLSDNQKNPALFDVVDELYQSMAILGVPKERVIVGEFETRRFMHYRQEILEFLIALNKKYEPEIVFVHSIADLHQDHGVVTQESLRAFRGTSIFGYDVIRSSYGFFPSMLFEVTKEDVEKKLQALKAYKTYSDKYYFSEEVTKSTLIRHGAIAERDYVEGFDILRIIGKFGR